MKLSSFRVTDFRSIQDTGWIEASRVTALIGTNESGKSNVLLALWKLKPAREGEIDLLADIPRSRFHILRNAQQKPVFIRAKFQFTENEVSFISQLLGRPVEEMGIAKVSRRLDGKVFLCFPDANTDTNVKVTSAKAVLNIARDEIEALDTAGSSEVPFKTEILESIRHAAASIDNVADKLQFVHEIFGDISPSRQLKTTVIVPAYQSFLAELVVNVVFELVPSFVYYANYGNLDSEIYLPHVIENMNRQDLSGVQAAKTRTLRVLFEFVNLEPNEILELGKEAGEQPDQIQFSAEKKKERQILLQSASSSLTRKFRKWWRQGNHNFEFQADGNHFRISVSDDIRPEKVELEGRSAGLQWFLSFFLVFLVERAASHKDAILLLDEPGVSLHPIAQEDLFEFFDRLSKENQMFYTSHSPFMVNADQLDRVRTVYYDEDGNDKGLTKVSADLRAREKELGEMKSLYPVHAALGISTSQGLLLGSTQIVVEGTSDQFYLSAIKIYLIREGLIRPKRELLFLPAGGTRGIKAVAPILGGKDGRLPIVILDSDHAGNQTAKQLKQSLYKGHGSLVISLSEICDQNDAEIEDLIPIDVLSWAVTRYLRGPAVDFSDVATDDEPHVQQVEDYAKEHSLELSKNWKVEVAKLVKQRILEKPDSIDSSSDAVKNWKSLFDLMCKNSE